MRSGFYKKLKSAEVRIFKPSYVDLINALESKSGDDETMSEYATAWGRKSLALRGVVF